MTLFPRISAIAFLCISALAAVRAAPVFTCRSLTVDVGTVKAGNVATAEFRIENGGDEPLLLSNIRVSCSACMRPAVSLEPIAPGSFTKLSVTVTKLPRTGPFRKFLYLHTNDPDQKSVRLIVAGVVAGTYELSPHSTFELGTIQVGEKKQWNYELAISVVDSGTITAIDTPRGIAIGAEAGSVAGHYSLSVSVSPEELLAGRLMGTARIHTTAVSLPVLHIPVTLLVRGPVMPVPEVLLLSVPEHPEEDDSGAKQSAAMPPVHRQLAFVASPGVVWDIADLDLPKGVLVSPLAGDSVSLDVRLASDVKPGWRLGDIIVRIGDSSIPSIRVPVLAMPAQSVRDARSRDLQEKAENQTLAFDELAKRLARYLDCSAEVLLAGGFQDKHTQLLVWLAEQLCGKGTAEERKRQTAFGGMSRIQYMRAYTETLLRAQRDPQYRDHCEKILTFMRGKDAKYAEQ